jgi:hypothetical protein
MVIVTTECQVRVCNVKYFLERVNRRDRFSMPLRSSAGGASFHTKQALKANVVRVIELAFPLTL